MNMKRTSMIAGMSAIAAVIIFGAAVAASQKNVQAQVNQNELFVAQKTGESAPDPLPGHSMHQAVLALPPRDDGMIWDGDVTWTASQPVEIVVLHQYNSTGVDDSHGEPLNAPFGDGKVAISLYKTNSNTPAAGGSTHFTGSAFAFHTLSGKPFTVTYSVKATALQPSG
jgi:hypothetical protein